ncbi:hypothetical protein KAR91_44575 [Candidatus Pacearchaeota archaeon]|nr:hypothetical protein [Candidatus Pacearchaeota archaeon]
MDVKVIKAGGGSFCITQDELFHHTLQPDALEALGNISFEKFESPPQTPVHPRASQLINGEWFNHDEKENRDIRGLN